LLGGGRRPELRALNVLEIPGVLAREMSHLANNDPTAMGLADVTTRLANSVSWMGQLILLAARPIADLRQRRRAFERAVAYDAERTSGIDRSREHR
jgi:Zn-dependent protease with chaperone function